MLPAEPILPRLIDALHSEALLLSDEARAYFDGPGRIERATLTPLGRVEFACEALKLTTRLTGVLGWLMDHRAARGSVVAAIAPLARAIRSDARTIGALPAEARMLVLAGIDLHARVARLERGLGASGNAASPARTLIRRLERAY